MANGIFVVLDEFITDCIAAIGTVIGDDRIEPLINCFKIAIIIYIIYKGYLVLAGKTQEPVRDLIWDLGSKAFILIFVQNLEGWLTLVINAIMGDPSATPPFSGSLYHWAAGGNDFATQADALIGKIVDYDILLLKYAKWYLYPILVLMLWISVGVGLIVSFGILVTTKLTLTVLLMISPVMIYCKLFGFTKNMFSQWLQLIFANLITVLVFSIVWKNVFELLEKLVNKVTANPMTNPTQTTFFLITVFILLAVVSKIAVSVGSSVASVSIEGAGMSAVSGAAGRAGSMGAMAARGAMGAMGAVGAAGALARVGGGVGSMVGGLAKGAGKLADNKIFKGKGQALAKGASDRLSERKQKIINWINTPRGS
jgi:type IV secretion system protein VirB6